MHHSPSPPRDIFSAPCSAHGNPGALKAHIGHRALLAHNMYMQHTRTLEEACTLALGHMEFFSFTYDIELKCTWDELHAGILGRIYCLLKRLPPSPFVPWAVQALWRPLEWGNWIELRRQSTHIGLVLTGMLDVIGPSSHPRPTPCSRPAILGGTPADNADA